MYIYNKCTKISSIMRYFWYKIIFCLQNIHFFCFKLYLLSKISDDFGKNHMANNEWDLGPLEWDSKIETKWVCYTLKEWNLISVYSYTHNNREVASTSVKHMWAHSRRLPSCCNISQTKTWKCFHLSMNTLFVYHHYRRYMSELDVHHWIILKNSI